MTGHRLVSENLARALHRKRTYEGFDSIRESAAFVVVRPPVFRMLNSPNVFR